MQQQRPRSFQNRIVNISPKSSEATISLELLC